MEENRNAYSEVMEILKWLDNEEMLEALPIEMLELLKSKVNPEYKPVISKEIPLEEQNLQPETIQILSWIATKYWDNELKEICDDEEFDDYTENITEGNKTQISEERNEIIHEEFKDKKINEEIVHKETDVDVNTEKDIQQENVAIEENKINQNLPIHVDNLKWYEKIKVKIIAFINKLFRKHRNIEEEGNI